MAYKELETFQAIVEHYQRENDVPLELIAASLAVLANGENSLLVKDELKQASFAGDSRRESRTVDRVRTKTRVFRSDRRPGSHRCTGNMETYRIEVGRSHQVQPGNIVGAIANEAGIGSESIGKIKIFDRFSTVDLPEGMPRDLLDTLSDIFIAGRKLRITQNGRHTRPPRSPRRRRQTAPQEVEGQNESETQTSISRCVGCLRRWHWLCQCWPRVAQILGWHWLGQCWSRVEHILQQSSTAAGTGPGCAAETVLAGDDCRDRPKPPNRNLARFEATHSAASLPASD